MKFFFKYFVKITGKAITPLILRYQNNDSFGGCFRVGCSMPFRAEGVRLLVLFIVRGIVHLITTMDMSDAKFSTRAMDSLMGIHVPANFLCSSHGNEVLNLGDLLGVSQLVLQSCGHVTSPFRLCAHSWLLRDMVQILWVEVEILVENSVCGFVSESFAPTRVDFDLRHACPCTQMHLDF